MGDTSTELTLNSTLITTLTSTLRTTSTIDLAPVNGSIFRLISNLFNVSELYKHQVADLLEPEKVSIRHIHFIIWSFSILTYLVAIPVGVRLIKTKAYLNVIEYFSFHIVLCAFLAWIPNLIFILHFWFQSVSIRVCRLHYTILSTNETVPFFFILYMIIERFLYAHPSVKQKFTKFSNMYFIHLYAIFTWLLIMVIYAFASPFNQRDFKPNVAAITNKYCLYDYSKLSIIATSRSIIYFCLLIPALVLIGFVLRYFYIMRGTNQVPPGQKLWTMRVTALVCVLVFYDIYLYYLEHVVETYQSLLVASMLRSTFYLAQVMVIACTELYWIQMLVERCACIFCICTGRRRKPTIPVAVPTETEFRTVSPTGHYSLVDDTVDDEFDHAMNGQEPTLRVVV